MNYLPTYIHDGPILPDAWTSVRDAIEDEYFIHPYAHGWAIYDGNGTYHYLNLATILMLCRLKIIERYGLGPDGHPVYGAVTR